MPPKLKCIETGEMLRLEPFTRRHQDHQRHARRKGFPNGQRWAFRTISLLLNAHIERPEMCLLYRNVAHMLRGSKAFDHERPISSFSKEGFRTPVHSFLTRMASRVKIRRILETEMGSACAPECKVNLRAFLTGCRGHMQLFLEAKRPSDEGEHFVY